jgi:hypothetical protein
MKIYGDSLEFIALARPDDGEPGRGKLFAKKTLREENSSRRKLFAKKTLREENSSQVHYGQLLPKT